MKGSVMHGEPMDESKFAEFLDRKKIDRRRFLHRFCRGSMAAAAVAAGNGLIPRLFKPAFATLYPNRVVRVSSPDATSWNGSASYYYDYVDTGVVKSMFNQGIQRLTDAASPTEAWQEIMGTYVSGQKVVIKVNLNNSKGSDEEDNEIDAIAPVVDEVLDGLTQAVGVPIGDILVYDTSKEIPIPRLVNRSRYSATSVFSSTFNVWDDSAPVEFRDDPEPCGYCYYDISKDLTDADHLINIPLLKRHDCGVTGALKNHYGSVSHRSHLHANMENNSYIGDVNNNTHIKDKTRLIVTDALFGNWATNCCEPPRLWQTFDNDSPNSLFFSLDPVAIDSVMLDYIRDERTARGLAQDPHDFLQVAMDWHGLGVHEHKPYSGIQYIDSDARVTRGDVDRAIRQFKAEQISEQEVLNTITQYQNGE